MGYCASASVDYDLFREKCPTAYLSLLMFVVNIVRLSIHSLQVLFYPRDDDVRAAAPDVALEISNKYRFA